MHQQLIRSRLVSPIFIFSLTAILLAGCSLLSSASRSDKDDNLASQTGESTNGEQTKPPAACEEAGQQKTVLWDFRKQEGKPQHYSNTETNLVLKYLFGDKWDADLGISGRLSGSFTR